MLHRKNHIRILLDLCMAIILVSLMDTQITGLELHELLGLGLYGFFMIHKILNRRWIIGVTRTFFKRLPWRTRLNYILDILQFIGFTGIIISGGAISRTMLWLPGTESVLWTVVHLVSAIVTFTVTACHVGLHLRFVISCSTKIARTGSGRSKPPECAAGADMARGGV